MINSETMTKLENLGFGADIDALEDYVIQLRTAAAIGEPEVSDAEYDSYFKLLKELKPSSRVFFENWEEDDEELESFDSLLDKYGMCSITTVDSIDPQSLRNFAQAIASVGTVELFASVKENGHGVRAVYSYGKLISGTTRGRTKKGRDITRHLKRLLPNEVADWSEIPLVEIRGEALVKISTFETYLKDTLKHPLSSVTSLIRESATDEEIDMLNMVCYKILCDDERLHFNTLMDEFIYLRDHGFEIPQNAVLKGVTANNLVSALKSILQYFENLMDSGAIEYSCDGIVVAINNNEDFYATGKNGNARNGNIALKTGKYWESNVYSAVIQSIQWEYGKSNIIPKAAIEPVRCSNGATVSVVPLYNVGVMSRFGYVPGEKVYFRFGGETGVTLCDVYGNSVKK